MYICIDNNPHCNFTGVISNDDSTDVTLASQLNKDFLKKKEGEDEDDVEKVIEVWY
jgi:hypothetical protein